MVEHADVSRLIASGPLCHRPGNGNLALIKQASDTTVDDSQSDEEMIIVICFKAIRD